MAQIALKKWSLYLFIFELWKGNHLDAKVMARAPISWLDKCRKYNHLIGYISNSNFQTFKFKTNFCVCWLLLQNIFLTLINTFVFFVSLLFDAFSSSIKTEKSQKNLFTLVVENNFGKRKLLCTCLNFGEILFAGTKRAVPGGQYRSILPAQVANQNTEFAAYCPLVELAI